MHLIIAALLLSLGAAVSHAAAIVSPPHFLPEEVSSLPSGHWAVQFHPESSTVSSIRPRRNITAVRQSGTPGFLSKRSVIGCTGHHVDSHQSVAALDCLGEWCNCHMVLPHNRQRCVSPSTVEGPEKPSPVMAYICNYQFSPGPCNRGGADRCVVGDS